MVLPVRRVRSLKFKLGELEVILEERLVGHRCPITVEQSF